MTASEIFAPGRGAVIFGAASGIGLAAAQRCDAAGMRVAMADADADALQASVDAIGAAAPAHVVDVSDPAQVNAVAAAVKHWDLALVMNNAGRSSGGAGPFADLEKWRAVFETNFWGVAHGIQAFTPMLLEQGARAAIVNTGSKQGITNPPGDLAYNATKAGVRFVTEGLQHALRSTDGARVTAHLLIPGFTYTGMIARRMPQRPPAAWTPEQVVERMIQALDKGDFYILCPDNETTEAMDARRIQWSAGDIIESRPALSRWHPDFKAAFDAYMREP